MFGSSAEVLSMNSKTAWFLCLASWIAPSAQAAPSVRGGQTWTLVYEHDDVAMGYLGGWHSSWLEGRGGVPATHAVFAGPGPGTFPISTVAPGMFVSTTNEVLSHQSFYDFPAGTYSHTLFGGDFDGLSAAYDVPESLLGVLPVATMTPSTREILSAGLDWSHGPTVDLRVSNAINSGTTMFVMLDVAGGGGSSSVGPFMVGPDFVARIPSPVLQDWTTARLTVITARYAEAPWRGIEALEPAYLNVQVQVQSGTFAIVPGPAGVAVLALSTTMLPRRRWRT